MLKHVAGKFKRFNILFISDRRRHTSNLMGGGGGNSTLGGPCRLTPVFRTGDFRNSSTPPHGAPPRIRTAHAEFAARPLAICCCGAWRPGEGTFCFRIPYERWLCPGEGTFCFRIPYERWLCPGGDSNTQSRVWNPLASPSATGACGAPGSIRTSTVPLLRRLPLPLDYGRMVGSVGFEPTLDAV